MDNLQDNLLDQYDYASDPVLAAHLHAADRARIASMMRFTRGVSGFGAQMTAHQNRVAKDGARFLLFLGFSARAARNYRAALLFHDMGKNHALYSPATWMKNDRPTPADRALMRRHARLGADMLDDYVAAHPGLKDHPHIRVRYAVTRYHHERADFKGPEKIDIRTMPTFVQAACLVDAFDGDLIPRPHQDHQRTPAEELRRLQGWDDPYEKYVGAFDPALLQEFVKMKQQQFNITE